MPASRFVPALVVACALGLGSSSAVAGLDFPQSGLAASRKCGQIHPTLAGAAEKVGATTIRARQGTRLRLVFKSTYPSCRGTVVVTKGKRKLGKAVFEDGRAVFRFPRDLERGNHTIRVTFKGNTMKLTLKITRS